MSSGAISLRDERDGLRGENGFLNMNVDSCERIGMTIAILQIMRI